MSESPILFPSDDEENEPIQEIQVLKKFQAMLQGVPPPSSVTLSKLTVSDMLSKYKANESSFGVRCCKAPENTNQKSNPTPLVYYQNSSCTSEEIAKISQKVQSRYIYLETLSSCNIWFDSAIKTNSAKKKSGRRNGFGLSPGSRLSHLAKRRQMFSCENLQQLANSDKRRHIEIKKNDASKIGHLEGSKIVENKKVNSFKRALFLSPDDAEKKTVKLTSNTIKRNLFPSSDNRKLDFQNAGNATEQVYLEGWSSKKRKRTESREGIGNWPRRALTFTEEDSNLVQERKSSKVISDLQLSLHHKSKLLWAVSTTLKEKNMSSKDSHFKICASALFMICRKNLGKIINSEVKGGTSEKMLHFARQQIGDIFEKLGLSMNGDSHSSQNIEGLGIVNDKELANNIKDFSNDFKIGLVCSNKNLSFISTESNINEIQENSSLQTNNNEKENIDLSIKENYA